MDVYQIVTDKIISMLERGVVPWRKCWNAGSGMPRNLVSKKEYRGFNVFLLGASPYSSPYWLTYKQAHDLGGHVNRGEKSSLVVFWKMLNNQNQEEIDSTTAKAFSKAPAPLLPAVLNRTVQRHNSPTRPRRNRQSLHRN